MQQADVLKYAALLLEVNNTMFLYEFQNDDVTNVIEVL